MPDDQAGAPKRPILTIDLSGSDGNVFMVIGKARELLSGEPLERYNEAIHTATAPGSGNKYLDILAIVNQHVRLVDSSSSYAMAVQESEQQIIAAVDRLNEQLSTLPDTISCSLEEIYPEFGVPDCGPEVYLALVEHELQTAEGRIGQAEEGQRALPEQLCAMLRECAAALRAAGVEPELPDGQAETTGLLEFGKPDNSLG